MSFKSKISRAKIKGQKPVEGILYIGKIFEYTGKWRDGFVYGQCVINDTQNKKDSKVPSNPSL